ncbi:TPA: hypothetical protein ACYLM8_002203 [Burkholderia lata]|nr:hypothetical protein [Burkholderia aenigmatica]
MLKITLSGLKYLRMHRPLLSCFVRRELSMIRPLLSNERLRPATRAG